MRVTCDRCSACFRVKDELGGRRAKCSRCGNHLVLPIPDDQRLLEWAKIAPWKVLYQFISEERARGHPRDVIRDLIRIFQTRRDAKIDQELADFRRQKHEKAEKRRSMRRARELQQARKRLERQHCLRDLRQLDPTLFEERIADLFNVQGYKAHAVGGPRDRGIDVVICRSDGTPWAVAQCKRYGFANRVSSSEIVHFCGAFHLSQAQCGFFFTTGGYTKEARRCAKKMPWLKIHDGKSLVELILNIIAGQGPDSEAHPS